MHGGAEQRQGPPQQVTRTQQVPYPVHMGGAPAVITTGGGVAPVKAQPGLIVKQTVSQEIGTRKARKRRASKGTKGALKAKKTEYNQLKKSLRQRLVKLKKDGYTAETARIKSLPPKERAAARKAVRAILKNAFNERVKMLPTLGRRSYNDIVALINKLRKFKW